MLDERTAALVEEVCSELGKTAFVVEEVRAAIAQDPRLAGRLALWGRRLLGEMLSQAQTVAAEHDGLADLVLNESIASQIDLVGAARPADRRARRADDRPGPDGVGVRSGWRRWLPGRRRGARGQVARRSAVVVG